MWQGYKAGPFLGEQTPLTVNFASGPPGACLHHTRVKGTSIQQPFLLSFTADQTGMSLMKFPACPALSPFSHTDISFTFNLKLTFASQRTKTDPISYPTLTTFFLNFSFKPYAVETLP